MSVLVNRCNLCKIRMVETVKNKRIWLKAVLWTLLVPVFLFVLLMASLYVPAVQDFIRRKATQIASEATGMQISVERIDLRFPLNLWVRGVCVVQPADEKSGVSQPDTLLNMGSLDVQVQAWPLFKGQVEVDGITLQEVSLNSGSLVEGVKVKGTMGRFFLRSHGVDLLRESVVLNNVELSDTYVQVALSDTTAVPEDTTATAPLQWQILLHALKLQNVSVDLQMPLDTLSLSARLGDVQIDEALADLGRQAYGWDKFLLSNSSMRYDAGVLADSIGRAQPAAGFDPSHIALRDIRIGIDSVYYCGRQMNALIREFAMNERSGLSITSLKGSLMADSTVIRVPSLRLLTPHSDMDLTAQTYWELVKIPTTGRLTARFNAHIGKQDVLLFAGGLPESFAEAYPFRPLVIQAGTEGNLKQMQISRFSVNLPGAFSLSGGGEFWNLNDSIRRSGKVDLDMLTQDLNFLTALGGATPDGSVTVPDSMRLSARMSLEGSALTAALELQEDEGRLNLDAAYNLSSEAYRADLVADSLQIHHFLPKDSLYLLSARVSASGQGTDLQSSRTVAAVSASLQHLYYGQWKLTGIDLHGGLKSSVASAQLTVDNSLLKMQGSAGLRLDRQYLDGRAAVNVENVDFYRLGFAPQPLKHPFAFRLGAEARRDSVNVRLNAGDLDFRFQARSTLKRLMTQANEFTSLLMQQLDSRYLDHAALRRALPSAGMQLKAGRENPVRYFLAARQIAFDDFSLRFGFTPERGINGSTAIHGLRTDSLQLDTVFFAIRQDTTRMRLQGGVINGPRNPQFVFRSILTGEVRNEDAELMVNFTDGNGKTGLHFGINARPFVEGNSDGLLLHMVPEEPVIAFRKFRFADRHNWIYLHNNMRVYANIDMQGDDGMGFRMQSNVRDTVSLQNINLELNRFRLSELSGIMPYLPRLTGLFSVEANYVQTPSSLQVSAEASVKQLTYEGNLVGDIGLGTTWFPVGQNTHYVNSYLTCNNEEVFVADGKLEQRNSKNILEVSSELRHLPLSMANAFVPDQIVNLSGDVDGHIDISGTADAPRLNGQFMLDSVSVYARQAGARFWFDNRPVRIENNRLVFDKFALYTVSENPFTIEGQVDFRNLDRPTADLKLNAVNYAILDARRTRESLVYGKVYVDVAATVRGPLDALTMRGNMNLLGNTNVTYVLTDSPLSVEDRLEGLVTFTSFTDTTTVKPVENTLSLGGMDVLMSVHIDDAVRLRADLTPDGSKFIELVGGGNLNLQYTPQGDMSLTGRYTLSGGVMKYSLPIIPLKEFSFDNGSYVDWRGDLMNPVLNLKATERIRASVADSDGEGARMVNFDLSIAIRNRLEAPELVFDITAPEDATVENELRAMGAEERSKQAIAMMATGLYMNNNGKNGGLSMGAALNSVIQSQINALAGGVKGASISVGIEDRTSSETGDKQTDYSFRYSQRFFNDRIQVVIGGKVSTGANATNDAESFIDNISVEYRLDDSSTRYIRVFHNKNYESVLDGEITETGIGLVLRRKMDRLGELFIFRKKKPKTSQ